jgi:hypothetical protein
VIRCSHCGKLAPAGATSCQNCGMPLVSANNVAGTRGSQQQDQSELPAWLESLRAHERPVSSGNGGDNQPFSMAELVDENAMPSWMRQDQSRLAENSDAFPALSANTRPGSGPERQAFPANGLEANSLIDEQSLPAWMRGQDGGQPAPGQSMSANSLVQRDSLPAWMKSLDQSAPVAQPPVQSQQYGLPVSQAQPPTQVQSYNLPPQAPVTPPPSTNLAQAPQAPLAYGLGQKGFSAGELVDSKSLPNWMTNGQGSPGQSPQTRPVPTERGFMAGELIDQNALPNWMKSAQGQGKSDPVSAMGVPVTGSGSGQGTGQGILGGVGMPASSLLDISAMPAWMQESEQGNAGAGSAMGYTPGTPQQPMSAGSLIDASTLPAWMRNSDVGQPASGARGAQQSPRAESMRVPSRPRAEIVPQEQSEQAANVFSSMLGVAASSPFLPGQAQMQENNLGIVQGQQMSQPRPQPASPVLPGWQSPQQPVQAPTLQQQQAWQMSGSLPGMATTSKTPGTGGLQPGGMNSAQTNYAGQSGYGGTSDTNRASAGPMSSAGSDSKGEVQTARAKKKGFFDSIRDFISK